MALTEIEKTYLKQIAVYYTGQIPNVDRDEDKLDVVVSGTDEEKKVIVSEFCKTVVRESIAGQIQSIDQQKVRLQQEDTMLPIITKVSPREL